MEKKPPYRLTPFDCLVTNDTIQMLKLLLPYMPEPFQRLAGMYAKFSELINAFYYFQPPYYHSRRGRLRQKETGFPDILEELAPYMPEEFAESMENAVQMMQMMDLFSASGGEAPVDLAAFAEQMLTPEQKEMFQAFQQERTENNERMDGSSGSSESGSPQTGTDPDSGPADTGQEREGSGSGDAFSDHGSF